MIAQRATHSGMASLLACLWLAVLGAGHAAAMTSQGALGDVLFGSAARDDRRAPPPPVARYVSDDGEAFVLDRSGGAPLLKFQQSSEVFVLNPSQASRGDIIYRNELGEPVLRVTRLGGLTLFSHDRPGGAAVAMAGQAASLRLQAMSPSALGQRFLQASVKASRAAKHLIVFDAQEITPGSEAVFADAAAVTVEAVLRLARRADGRSVLARFGRVLFTPGTQSSARVERGVMNITVEPSKGIAGRPSSARIVQAVARAQ